MTRTIEISVRERIAWQTNHEEYICGNGDFAVDFVFDQEWADVGTKTARFIHGEQYTDVVFSGTRCAVPVILDTRCIRVGVYAGDLRTTTAATVECKKSILCDDGLPSDPIPDVYAQLMEKLDKGISDEDLAKAIAKYMTENPVQTGSVATLGTANLIAAKWVGEGNLHSQVVDIDGVTENSQVDLTPDVEQLVVFYEKDLTFVTENDGGVVTVYAIGQKPANDYTIQVTITEVNA